jgi:hypothetical protein
MLAGERCLHEADASGVLRPQAPAGRSVERAGEQAGDERRHERRLGMGDRKLLVLALAVVVLGGLLVTPVALAADTPAWVAGTVKGTGYNYTVNLSGATVDLWQVTGTSPSWTFTPLNFPATTAPDGQYVINVLTQDTDASLPLYYGGNCVVVPTAQYYRTSTDLTKYLPAFSVLPWTWTQSDATYKTLTVLESVYKGKVVKKSNGKALKGVKVVVAGNKNYNFKTNSNGRYTTYKVTTDKQTICLLKPGTKYKIKFTKSGYKAKTITVTSAPMAYVANSVPATWVDLSTVKLVKK